MPLIEWNDSYSVQIREIDRQHLKLVEIINDLHDAMLGGKANDVLGKLIGELGNYTKTHFAAEEGYLARYGYPDLKVQQREHAFFIDKLTEINNNVESGRFGVSMDVMKFLKDWLLKHIKGTDMKYVAFLTEKGLS